MHDANVTFDLGGVIADRRVVGVMGGHQLPRDSADYANVAELARDLARRGMLVCTGGGPGAMEASHLGAAVSQHPDAVLGETIAGARGVPRMPDLHGILSLDGKRRPGTRARRGGVVRAGLGGEPRDRRAGAEPLDPDLALRARADQPVRDAHREAVPELDPRGRAARRSRGRASCSRGGAPGRCRRCSRMRSRTSTAQHPDYFSPMVFLGRGLLDAGDCRWGRCSTRCRSPLEAAAPSTVRGRDRPSSRLIFGVPSADGGLAHPRGAASALASGRPRGDARAR